MEIDKLTKKDNKKLFGAAVYGAFLSANRVLL